MKKKIPLYEDFHSWMPLKLKEAVFQTEICKRFLFERKRISKTIYQHIKAGGSMNDECLKADIEQLQSLAAELGVEIDNIKRRMSPDSILD